MVSNDEKTLKTITQKNLSKSKKFVRKVSVVEFRYSQTFFFFFFFLRFLRQRAKSYEQRAKSNEQRAKSNEQREESNEQRVKRNEQRANSSASGNVALFI